jgi:hypothetical protein
MIMEEEFYAIIKLISGEEVFAKVCPCEENNKTILILDNPVTVELMQVQQIGMTALKLNPWITFSDESMFIIDFDKIITISEVSDKNMLKLYNKFLSNKSKSITKRKLSKRMGYLSTIADARIILEKIYNQDN